MAHPVAESFLKAAELFAADARRQGNLLTFAPGEQIVYTGDIHGERANLNKIIAFAGLPARPQRRLVCQEIIHGGPPDAQGADRSVELLMRLARLKTACPDHVFILMGNHELAQFTGNEITKEGRGTCRDFNAGIEHAFGDWSHEVRSAAETLMASLPLAARCSNGMFMAHSLPSPGRMELMDWDVLGRPYRPDDLHRGGSVYELVWGRGHTPPQLQQIAARLGVRQFLLGHQHIATGFEIQHGCLLILASDHPHGAVAVFDAGTGVPDDHLPDLVRPIAAL